MELLAVGPFLPDFIGEVTLRGLGWWRQRRWRLDDGGRSNWSYRGGAWAQTKTEGRRRTAPRELAAEPGWAAVLYLGWVEGWATGMGRG